MIGDYLELQSGALIPRSNRMRGWQEREPIFDTGFGHPFRVIAYCSQRREKDEVFDAFAQTILQRAGICLDLRDPNVEKIWRYQTTPSYRIAYPVSHMHLIVHTAYEAAVCHAGESAGM